MEEEFTFEELREYCSKYIRKHFGEQYDFTPWMDKLTLYSTYKDLKKHEENYGKICDLGQNEQETKT